MCLCLGSIIAQHTGPQKVASVGVGNPIGSRSVGIWLVPAKPHSRTFRATEDLDDARFGHSHARHATRVAPADAGCGEHGPHNISNGYHHATNRHDRLPLLAALAAGRTVANASVVGDGRMTGNALAGPGTGNASLRADWPCNADTPAWCRIALKEGRQDVTNSLQMPAERAS